MGIKPGNCKRQDRLNAENEEKLNQATLPSKKAKRKRDKILNPSLDLLTPTQKYVADLNEDNVVNVFDIIIIINIILD